MPEELKAYFTTPIPIFDLEYLHSIDSHFDSKFIDPERLVMKFVQLFGESDSFLPG